MRKFLLLLSAVILGLFAAGYKSGLDRRQSDSAIIASSLEKAQVLRSSDGKFAVAISCGRELPNFAYFSPLGELPQLSVRRTLHGSLTATGRAIIGPAGNVVQNPVFEAGVAGASVAEIGKSGLKSLREEAVASKASRAVRLKAIGILLVGAGAGYYLGDWLAGLPPVCGSPEALAPLKLIKNQADLERRIFDYDQQLISDLDCTPRVAHFKRKPENRITNSTVDKCTTMQNLISQNLVRAVEVIRSNREALNSSLESAESIAQDSELNYLRGRMKNEEFDTLWNRCEKYRSLAGQPICALFR